MSKEILFVLSFWSFSTFNKKLNFQLPFRIRSDLTFGGRILLIVNNTKDFNSISTRLKWFEFSVKFSDFPNLTNGKCSRKVKSKVFCILQVTNNSEKFEQDFPTLLCFYFCSRLTQFSWNFPFSYPLLPFPRTHLHTTASGITTNGEEKAAHNHGGKVDTRNSKKEVKASRARKSRQRELWNFSEMISKKKSWAVELDIFRFSFTPAHRKLLELSSRTGLSSNFTWKFCYYFANKLAGFIRIQSELKNNYSILKLRLSSWQCWKVPNIRLNRRKMRIYDIQSLIPFDGWCAYINNNDDDELLLTLTSHHTPQQSPPNQPPESNILSGT